MKFRVVMEIGFKIFVGASQNKGNKQILGAVLGIALGLLPLIVVLNVTDGMISGITSRYLETLTYHFQLYSYEGWSEDRVKSLRQGLKDLEEVTQVFPELQGFGLGYSESQRMGITIRGLPGEVLEEDRGFRQYLAFDEGGPTFKTTEGVLLGREVARRLGVKMGDSLKILTARSFAGRSFVPRVSSFVVEGIFSSGYQELDKLWAFIPYDRAQMIMTGNEFQTIMAVKVTDPYGDLGPVLAQIRAAAPPSTRIFTWKEKSRAQFQNFQTTRTLLLFIMLLIFFVSSFNISSAIFMMIMDKQKEIAFLKSVGAKPGEITQIFTVMGLILGGAGTLLGTAAGVLASYYLNEIIQLFDAITMGWSGLVAWFEGSVTPLEGAARILNSEYYLERIPFSLDGSTLFLIILSSLHLSVLAAWLPAVKAGRLRPLEVLRKY